MANAEEERDGWQVESRGKNFLRRPPPVMVERSGTVVSAQRRACGQGRNAEGARQTVRQCCKGSTSKRSQRRRGGVARTRLRQESAKTRFWDTRPIGMRRPSYVNCMKKSGNWRKRDGTISSVQFVGAGEEGKPEEVGKLEVDEEVDSKKKLDQREKELQKQFRKIDEFPDRSRGVVDQYKEKWQQELQDIEQRMICRCSIKKCRKRSQKLQCLQDRKNQCQKDMTTWVGDREKAKNEIQERLV